MASSVKPIPDGTSVVIPRLVCQDPAAAIDFCLRTRSAPSKSVAGPALTAPSRMRCSRSARR